MIAAVYLIVKQFVTSRRGEALVGEADIGRCPPLHLLPAALYGNTWFCHELSADVVN